MNQVTEKFKNNSNVISSKQQKNEYILSIRYHIIEKYYFIQQKSVCVLHTIGNVLVAIPKTIVSALCNAHYTTTFYQHTIV